jgi:putative holliday junction resolvase
MSAQLPAAALHPPPRSDAPTSFLAFDFGERRVGVASGNTVTGSATPLLTINAQGDARFQTIARLIREWQPSALVVGVPRHPDGQPHAMTAHCERFARQLEGRYGLSVLRVDERYSSVEAEHDTRTGDLDARSAAIILDQHLRTLA